MPGILGNLWKGGVLVLLFVIVAVFLAPGVLGVGTGLVGIRLSPLTVVGLSAAAGAVAVGWYA